MVKSGPFDHKSGQKMTHLTIKNKELRKFLLVNGGPFDHFLWSNEPLLTITK